MEITILIAVVVVLAITFLLHTKEETKPFEAEFVSDSDIGSRYSHAFSIGGKRFITQLESTKNMLILGSSGSSKGASFIIPGIYNTSKRPCIQLIVDPGLETYQKTSGFLHKQGINVIKYNFTERGSFGYNPFAKEDLTVSDIEQNVEIQSENSKTRSQSDPHWATSAVNATTMFLKVILALYPKEFVSFPSALKLIRTYTAEPSKIDPLFIKAGGELYEEYKAFNKTPAKELQSVLSSCRTMLKLYADPIIAHNTSHNSLDISSLRSMTTPTTIFLCTPVAALERTSPLLALFITNFYSTLMSKPKTAEQLHTYVFCDEANTVYIPNFSTLISNSRRFGVSTLCACQSMEALAHRYSQYEAENIVTNCHTKAYLEINAKTAKELSTQLGYHYRANEDGHKSKELLLSVPEIRLTEDAIILQGNKPPARVKKLPYYKHSTFKHYAKIPPYEPPEVIADQKIITL